MKCTFTQLPLTHNEVFEKQYRFHTKKRVSARINCTFSCPPGEDSNPKNTKEPLSPSLDGL